MLRRNIDRHVIHFIYPIFYPLIHYTILIILFIIINLASIIIYLLDSHRGNLNLHMVINEGFSCPVS